MATASQATIFLTNESAGLIEAARRQWDPAMSMLIGAHVTLLYAARSRESLESHLSDAALQVRPFRLLLGQAQRWKPPDEGIYLTVEDVDGGLSDLRALLAPVSTEEHTMPYIPHLTLVHPRTATTLHDAWQALRQWRLDELAIVDTVAVITPSPNGYQTTATFTLGEHGRSDT